MATWSGRKEEVVPTLAVAVCSRALHSVGVKAKEALGCDQRGHHPSCLALGLTVGQAFHSSWPELVTGTS